MGRSGVNHPDKHMMTDLIDHEAARKRCEKYIKDFDKIVQHSKVDVNLMRSYLELHAQVLEKDAVKAKDRKLKSPPPVESEIRSASDNTVPIPIMGEAKEVPVKVDFSCTHGGEDEPTPSFRFIDGNSGCLIMDVRLDYKSFGQLMTGLGHRPAKGRIFDTFKVVGLYCEHKTVFVTRPKKYTREDRNNELTEIIERECGEFLSSGWGIHTNGLSTQQNDLTKWKVILYRFVKEKPDSKTGE